MNTIKSIFQPSALLRLFIGVIFLSAGIYRIFNWQNAISELSQFNLNYTHISILIIALEVIGGLLLIFNIKTKKVLIVFIVFILLALIAALSLYGKDIISKSRELFIFSPTPTDVFLHFTYLIILIYLLGKKNKN